MPWYRLYYLKNDRIFAAEDLEAANDSDAALTSTERSGAHTLELWHGTRRVTSFPEAPPSVALPGE